MWEKNAFQVSFIKALTPRSRRKVKRDSRKKEGLKRVFLRENPSEVSFFLSRKMSQAALGVGGKPELSGHAPERLYLPTTKASKDSEPDLLSKAARTPPRGGKGRSPCSQGDENGPVARSSE